MFKKIKKIGIYWGLFIAVFLMKNDTINAASFTYIPKQSSVIEIKDLGASMSASYQMPPVLFYDPYQVPPPSYRSSSVHDSRTSSYQPLVPIYNQVPWPGYSPSPSVHDSRTSSYQPLAPIYDPYQVPWPGYSPSPSAHDSRMSSYQPLASVYDPYQVPPPSYRLSSAHDSRTSSYQPLVPIYNQMLQNVIRYVFTGKTWEMENNKPLDIHTLYEYLYTLKNDVLRKNDILREVGRLLIAQNFTKYNCPENNLLTYIAKKNEDPHNNQISMDEYQDALVNTKEMKFLSNFMAENGSLGKFASSMRDNSRIKGIFNLDKDTKEKVMDDGISENKKKNIASNVAKNILEYLFSENIKLKHIGKIRPNNTFELDVIYKGRPIPGLEKPKPGRSFYLSKGSVRCGNTNGIRIVLALSNKKFPPYVDGLIRFADLYIVKLSD